MCTSFSEWESLKFPYFAYCLVFPKWSTKINTSRISLNTICGHTNIADVSSSGHSQLGLQRDLSWCDYIGPTFKHCSHTSLKLSVEQQRKECSVHGKREGRKRYQRLLRLAMLLSGQLCRNIGRKRCQSRLKLVMLSTRQESKNLGRKRCLRLLRHVMLLSGQACRNRHQRQLWLNGSQRKTGFEVSEH